MTNAAVAPRFDWTREEIAALFDLPLPDLLLRALEVRRANWPEGRIQKSQLLSIKTGGCPEDCGYCSQSAHFKTGLNASKLMDVDAVLAEARQAKANGADRFCMGAAWRSLKDRDLPKVCEMISAVKAEGLETCVTLGMLEEGQAEKLKAAGLDYYNHNLDTSREYYGKVTSTRTYDDRLETLDRCRKAGVSLCCGGILGMGEQRSDRVGLIHELSKIKPHPESVPINALMPIEGTPLGKSEPISAVDLARAIAVSRIVFPASWIRLSAGRENMTEEGQALCLAAGANSFFVGSKLLTTANPEASEDEKLLDTLGMEWGPRTDKPQVSGEKVVA
ncbi:MAG: biotin synthase BioB [Hyphomonadaceae bacterium]|nr:biotin synthase BioB [Hyphomonadaceae bacterium]